MSLVLTGSISLDSTFKFRVLIFTGYDIIPENIDNAKKNYSSGKEKWVLLTYFFALHLLIICFSESWKFKQFDLVKDKVRYCENVLNYDAVIITISSFHR